MGLYWKVISLSSKRALLCLIWVVLVWHSFFLSISSVRDVSVSRAIFNIYYATGLIYPVAGWIADVWTGRYKMITASLYICFTGSILKTIFILVEVYYYDEYYASIVMVLYYIGFALTCIGQCCFVANIIPFIIDQLITEGASGDQLSAAIHWFYWACNIYLLAETLINSDCLANADSEATVIIMPAIASLFMALAILSNHIYHGVLYKEPLIMNPAKQIASILNFARKNKYPRNRSALTYWEERGPSRIDLGKDKYGGPFTEEEVEDVKTVLRMLPLLFCSAIVGIQTEPASLWPHLQHPNVFSTGDCLLYKEHIFTPLMILIGVPVYHFILYPLVLYRYNIKMLKSLGVAILSSLISVIVYCSLDVAGHLMDSSSSCYFNKTDLHQIPIDYRLLMTGEFFHELAYALGIIKSLEFTVAQSPCRMRGLMLGLWYAVFRLSQLVGINVHFIFEAFLYSPIRPSCLFYYHIVKIIILASTLIAFVVLSRRYELRVREREINFYQVAENCYDRLLQESCNNQQE